MKKSLNDNIRNLTNIKNQKLSNENKIMKSQIDSIKKLKINSNFHFTYLNVILLLLIIGISLYYYYTEGLD